MGPADGPEIAVEVTGAVDEPWMSTWYAADKRTGIVAGVVDDWTIVVRAGARINRIEKELPALLTAVRVSGVDVLRETTSIREPDLRGLLDQLGIRTVHRHDGPGTCFVHFMPDGDGGAVDSAGESVPGWVGEFLSQPERADNLRKLAASTAPRREVFVPVDVRGAPWSVLSYLTDLSRRSSPVPPGAPDLPHPVTGVWLASTFYFGDCRGVRWDSTSWSSFRSRGVGVDYDEKMVTEVVPEGVSCRYSRGH